MNDSGALESLVITSTSRGALDVAGGATTGSSEVKERALLNHVDVQRSANIGGDLSVCGELRADKLFHVGVSKSGERELVWKSNLVPDSISTHLKRFDLGSEDRKWGKVWTTAVNSHRTDTTHLAASTIKSRALETESLVVSCAQIDKCVYNYETLHACDDDTLTISHQITVIYPNSSGIQVHLTPEGVPGTRLEIVSMAQMSVVLPDGTREMLAKGSSAKLFNCDDTWILYR